MTKNNSPAVILVRPQMGENIGATARAMSNFGLTDLRLVSPRDGWPNETAKRVAAGGEAIIDAARAYENTPSALADIQLAFAATARGRDLSKAVMSPQEAVVNIISMEQEAKSADFASLEPASCDLQQQITGANIKSAFVFGPERTGLENEDIALCDALLTIPTTPDNFSLNIAQSVVVIAYEWFKTQSNEYKVPSKELREDTSYSILHTQNSFPATKADYNGLFKQLEGYLDNVNFFRVPEKKPVMWNNTRNMLLRGRFSAQEIRTLRGILRVLWEGRKPRSNG